MVLMAFCVFSNIPYVTQINPQLPHAQYRYTQYIQVHSTGRYTTLHYGKLK